MMMTSTVSEEALARDTDRQTHRQTLVSSTIKLVLKFDFENQKKAKQKPYDNSHNSARFRQRSKVSSPTVFIIYM